MREMTGRKRPKTFVLVESVSRFLDGYVYFSPGETVEVCPNTLSSRLEDITVAHLLTKGEKHKHYSL